MPKKQFDINLVFNDNAKEAEAKVRRLQEAINSLQATTSRRLGTAGFENITNEMREAQGVVAQVSASLKTAFNVNTGKLNLTPFIQNLKDANLTINDISKSFATLGQQGQKAFGQLVQTIVQGEIPLRRTENAITKAFGVLANSAKWSIAYGTINKITDGIGSAFQYAENLNKSLTQIGVVTGKNVDIMSDFAEQANKAAKSLATSTKSYADAALIFYQQGLNDSEVAERTAATIKLANVTGESAKQASEQLTAIWNNFDDGSKKLEFYADVMAKLGAETASSADEIAAGFEKFASVADTVGLSYERGAAAIATVTAKTRQSADIVGTAFRTIFARLQDLDLGKTLDDGTTLGQYSQALKTVGINIKETSGELKSMDDILVAMGEKWKTLTSDQQVALAQSVAGTRQYAQLMALMNNYDYFQQLTNSAKTASGTLEEQQERWSEGWEAAQNKVKASAESLYSDLIDDKTIIRLSDYFAEFLKGIDSLVDTLGGMKTLLPLLLSGMLKLFGPQMASTIMQTAKMAKDSFLDSLGMGSLQTEKKEAIDFKRDTIEAQKRMLASNPQSFKNDVELKGLNSQLDIMTEIDKISGNLTEKEEEKINAIIATRQEYEKVLTVLGEIADKSTINIEKAKLSQENNRFASGWYRDSAREVLDESGLKIGQSNTIINRVRSAAKVDAFIEQLGKIKGTTFNTDTGKEEFNLKQFTEEYKSILKNTNLNSWDEALLKNFNRGGMNFLASLNDVGEVQVGNQRTLLTEELWKQMLSGFKGINAIGQVNSEMRNLYTGRDGVDDQKLAAGIEQATNSAMAEKEMITSTSDLALAQIQQNNAQQQLNKSLKDYDSFMEQAIDKIKQMGQEKAWADRISGAAMGLSMLTSSIGSLMTIIDQVKEMSESGEVSAQGLISIISSLTMGVYTLTVALNSLWATNPYLLAIVAALAVVAGAVKLVSDAYNADAIAAKKAAEEAKAVADEYNNIKQSFDDLKTSLEDYNDSYLTLKALTEGTEEWRDAVQDTNEKVLELMKNYPELADYITNNKGQLSISDEGQEYLLEAQSARVSTMYNAQLSANLRSEEASLKSKTTNTIRDISPSGEFESPMRAAITAVLQDVEKQGNSYFEDYENNIQTSLKGVSSSNEVLVKALQSAETKIKELSDTNVQLINQREAANAQMVNQYLSSKGFNAWGDYGSNVAKLAQQRYQSEKENFASTDELIAAPWLARNDFWYFDLIASEKGKEGVQKALDIQFGKGNAEATGSYSKKDGFKYRYKDSNGDWKTDSKSAEYFEDILESQAVNTSNAVLEYTTHLTNTISQLKYQAEFAENTNDLAGGAMAEFVNSDNFDLADPKYVKALQELGTVSEETLSGMDINLTALAEHYSLSSEEMLAKINDTIRAYDYEEAAAARQAQQEKDISELYQANAEALETTDSALELYGDHLLANNEALEEHKDLAAQASVEHFKLAKGIKQVRDVIEENAEILDEADEHSLDYYEALGKVKEALEDTFGLKLSSNFVKTADNMAKIKAMANGDAEALQELQKAAVKDFVVNLSISDSWKSQLTNELDELAEMAERNPIGAELEISSNMVDIMNDMLLNGQVTSDQLASMFSNMHIEMPELEYDKQWGPALRQRVTVIDPITHEATDQVTETLQQSEVLVPYFKGGSRKHNSTGGILSGTGTGNIKTRGMGNLHSLGDIVNYGKDTETSSDRKKRLDSLDAELERYHEIDEVIEDINRELDVLGTKKDRAFGRSKLNAIDEEIAKNKELFSSYAERVKEAERWYQYDRGTLQNRYKGMFQFDADGRITNYEEVMRGQINKLKGMSSTDTGYDDAKEYFETLKNDISKYEDSLDQLHDTQKNVIDAQNTLADLALEKITYKVEMRIDIDEDDKKYIDFMLGQLEDDDFAVAEKINQQTKAVSVLGDEIKATEQGIADIMADVNSQGFMSDAQAKQLRDYRDQLIDYNDNLKEIRKTVEEYLPTAYDAWNDKLDENLKKFSNYKSIIEHYRNIADIVGKDVMSNDILSRMWDSQVNNSTNAVGAYRARLEQAEQTLADYRKQRAAATSEEDIKYWDEQIKAATQIAEDARQEFNDKFEESLNDIADRFKNAVEIIAENFEASVSGIYQTLDDLNDAFGREKDLSERYLKDYEKAYEVNKLNRQIEDSINNSTSVKNQKELRDLQAELLEYRKDGANVSKYDMEYMQKRYDLLIAEQQLRDAQNAKSVVRLSRDSEGNYGYIYTADQTAVNNAQQNYEDKLYELQKWVDQTQTEIAQGLIQINQDYAKAIRDIDATTVEGQQRFAEITEYYQQKLKDWAEYGQNITDTNIKVNKQYNIDMAESFAETLGGMTTKQSEWNDYYKLSVEGMRIVNQDYVKALTGEGGYQESIDKAFKEAGTSVDTFEQQVKDDLDAVDKKSANTADEVEDLADEVANAMKDAAAAVGGFQSKYSSYMDGVVTSTGKAINEVTDLIKKYSELAAAAGTKIDTPSYDQTQGNQNGGDTKEKSVVQSKKDNTYTTISSQNTKNASTQKNVDFQLKERDWVSTLFGLGAKAPTSYDSKTTSVRLLNSKGMPIQKSLYNFEDKYVQKAFSKAKIAGYKRLEKPTDYATHLFKITNVTSTKKNSPSGTIYLNWTDLRQLLGKEEDISKYFKELAQQDISLPSFDTGGYTGKWGPEGRMAMLHQKELVLNAGDTENFLTAIQIVRSMADQLEANAVAARYGLSQFAASGVGSQNGEIVQNIVINADFPNATNHNEIEEALRNLANSTSQYIHRS